MAPIQITREFGERTPLKTFLLKLCPPDKNGFKSIPALADQIGISKAAINKWLVVQKIPARRVGTLLEISSMAAERAEKRAEALGTEPEYAAVTLEQIYEFVQ